MKIILVALNAKYVHSNLAVYSLQAYAEERLCREADSRPAVLVREYTINHNLDSILQSLYRERADVAAFSCYIWNIRETLSLVRELSKVSPDMRIWLGGPEVSYDAEKALSENPAVEGIMLGEGEQTFYELVEVWSRIGKQSRPEAGEGTAQEMPERTSGEGAAFEKDSEENHPLQRTASGKELENGYASVQGILYRSQSGDIRKTPERPLLSMDKLPFVYRDLKMFENRILYYETSRGCPFSCSYCLSSIDKTVRFRSISLVEQELAFFLEHRVAQVKFVDRTFNCNREHALAIWQYITEHDNGVTNFHFEVSADLITDEERNLFKKMRPGLIQLEIGLQSVNPPTIAEIRRSMRIERIRDVMLEIHSFGNIRQHLDLIAGLPYEDFPSFQHSFNVAYSMKPDQLQLGFLKVLKGSYMQEKAGDYGMQYQDGQPYEVLFTKWISYEEMIRLKKVEEMVELYYNSS